MIEFDQLPTLPARLFVWNKHVTSQGYALLCKFCNALSEDLLIWNLEKGWKPIGWSNMEGMSEQKADMVGLMLEHTDGRKMWQHFDASDCRRDMIRFKESDSVLY